MQLLVRLRRELGLEGALVPGPARRQMRQVRHAVLRLLAAEAKCAGQTDPRPLQPLAAHLPAVLIASIQSFVNDCAQE